MSTYIALIDWTNKGIKEVKDSPARADKAKALAEELGGSITQLYLTMGSHDLVVIMDMPDDEAMARFALTVGRGGHIRTNTLKAFDEAAYRKLTASV
ncbi:MAG: GYD domain-containing protein [Paracoccaceae bacterium]|nr:GYD domain-containing protein [Paracoccaceae bacterium]